MKNKKEDDLHKKYPLSFKKFASFLKEERSYLTITVFLKHSQKYGDVLKEFSRESVKIKLDDKDCENECILKSLQKVFTYLEPLLQASSKQEVVVTEKGMNNHNNTIENFLEDFQMVPMVRISSRKNNAHFIQTLESVPSDEFLGMRSFNVSFAKTL